MEHLLQQEQQCAEQLLAVMEKEYALLRDGRIDELPALTALKNEAINTLQSASRQREQLLQGTSLTKIRQSVMTLPNSAAVIAKLDKLNDLAQHCQKLNQLSGRLLRQQQNLSRDALCILQGQQASSTDTYTQQGAAHSIPQPRILGKA